MNFDFISLERKELNCEECGRSGKGYETEKGFEYLPRAIEIYCPICGNFFGEVLQEEE
jgi:Zn finger protein HypA/HybF involved in hydrogenase expression